MDEPITAKLRLNLSAFFGRDCDDKHGLVLLNDCFTLFASYLKTLVTAVYSSDIRAVPT